jgi:hypothetical protein
MRSRKELRQRILIFPKNNWEYVLYKIEAMQYDYNKHFFNPLTYSNINKFLFWLFLTSLSLE